MRRTICPILATGLLLSTAAVIVTNPVVAAPPDVSISAAEWLAGGISRNDLDDSWLLSLESFDQGLSRQQRTPVAVRGMENLPSEPVVDAPPLAPPVIAAGEPPPSYLPGPGSVLALSGSPAQAQVELAGSMADIAGETITTVADIARAAGISGLTLLRQISATPLVVAALAERVLNGTMTPAEALRRLLTAPVAVFSGYQNLTGFHELDALFAAGAFQPLVDAFDDNTGPLRPGRTETVTVGGSHGDKQDTKAAAGPASTVTLPQSAKPTERPRVGNHPSDDRAPFGGAKTAISPLAPGHSPVAPSRGAAGRPAANPAAALGSQPRGDRSKPSVTTNNTASGGRGKTADDQAGNAPQDSSAPRTDGG